MIIVLIYKNFEDGSKKRLVVNGHEFREEKRGLKHVPWVCTMISHGCRARFREMGNILEIIRPLQHNHAATFKDDDLDEYCVSIAEIKWKPYNRKGSNVIMVTPSDVKKEDKQRFTTNIKSKRLRNGGIMERLNSDRKLPFQTDESGLLEVKRVTRIRKNYLL